jgi:hypothetical protein
MTECSLFSSNRPAVLQNLPPHLIIKHHIHTASVSTFLSNILHSPLGEPEGNQAPQQHQNNDKTKMVYNT